MAGIRSLVQYCPREVYRDVMFKEKNEQMVFFVALQNVDKMNSSLCEEDILIVLGHLLTHEKLDLDLDESKILAFVVGLIEKRSTLFRKVFD